MKNLLLLPLFIFYFSIPVFSQNSTPKDSAAGSNDKDLVFTKTEIEASFPGGSPAWTRYISKQIQQHFDEILDDNKQGTCLIQFIVDTAGNVTNVKPLSMQGSKLCKVGIKAIVEGPKWVPAMQNGRRVKAFREQPITFTLQNK